MIRPKKDQKLPSKAEIAHIRQVASAARMRLKKAHCVVIASSTQPAHTTISDNEKDPQATPHTVRRLFTESPTPARGRFAALSTPVRGRSPQSSLNQMNE